MMNLVFAADSRAISSDSRSASFKSSCHPFYAESMKIKLPISEPKFAILFMKAASCPLEKPSDRNFVVRLGRAFSDSETFSYSRCLFL